MSSLKDVATDMVNFTISNVNDAISFKPHLCKEVPHQQYNTLKAWYIEFTGTSIRKNKCKLFFLPVNVSDELQQLNPVIPEEVKITDKSENGVTYYKNRLITELDFENVKRVQRACIYIAYAAVNQLLNLETDPSLLLESNQSSSSTSHHHPSSHSVDGMDPMESCQLSLRKGEILGFRELGHLISITPWHFHRVFKVITGLTIREYGQICVEFLKKNSDLVNPVAWKVTELKENGDSYSCLDDEDFMNEDITKYECDDNCVILPDYFIDLTKSKESKKKTNESPPSTGNSSNSSNKNENGESEPHNSGLSRSEQRKHRSSVMIQKIKSASICTISSNHSIQSALAKPSTPGQSSQYQPLTPSPAQHAHTQIQVEAHDPIQTQRRKFRLSRDGSVSGADSHGMITKSKHKRNASDPTNGRLLKDLELTKTDRDQFMVNTNNQSLAEAFTFPSPQVDFKFNMFDEASLDMDMDANLNPLKMSTMPLNSLNMNLNSLNTLGSNLNLDLPIEDIAEMSSIHPSPSTNQYNHHQAAGNSHMPHMPDSQYAQDNSSMSSTLPNTPHDINSLFPLSTQDSFLLEFSPEEPINILNTDQLFPLYPSSMLAAAPNDTFSTYEDFIAN